VGVCCAGVVAVGVVDVVGVSFPQPTRTRLTINRRARGSKIVLFIYSPSIIYFWIYRPQYRFKSNRAPIDELNLNHIYVLNIFVGALYLK
jgi:hypothetical protein